MLRPNYISGTLLRGFSLLLSMTGAGAAESPFRDLYFEPNRGQAARPIEWVARTPEVGLAFTSVGVEIQLGGDPRAHVGLKWAGANPKARFEAIDASLDNTSYYYGADTSRWVPNVPHYRRLAWRDVYPGVDVIFYGHQGKLEYDLVVAPGADPSVIRLAFAGVSGVRINNRGDLVVEAGKSSFEMQKPKLYQRFRAGIETPVTGGYHLARSGLVSFTVGAFDPSRALVVDPVLNFANYIGGEKDDSVVAVTAQGDIVGVTASLAFAEGSAKGGRDVFALLNLDGGRRLYMMGGSDDDVATCAVASSNALVIGGWTRSGDFLDKSAFGGTDGFLLALDRGSSAAPKVVRIGGSGDDRVNAVGYGIGVYFAGETDSPDLRSGGVAAQSRLAGGTDAFVGIASGYGSTLSPYYLAYFGGSGDDAALAVSTDNRGRAIVAGRTTSVDLPLKDALYSQLAGPSDGFLARFELLIPGAAPALEFATYFGSSGADEIRALASQVTYTAQSTFVYFAGTAGAGDLPLVNPAQPQFGGGDSDAFAGAFDLDSRKLVFSTYIGGSGRDEATAVALPSSNYYVSGLSEPVVAGSTTSSDLPVHDAVQERLSGLQDAFLAYFDILGSLQSLTYLGGSGSDRALAVSFSADNVATVGGETDSLDFAVAARNSAPTAASGGLDGFTAGVTLTRFSVIGAETGYWAGRDITTCGSVFLSADIPDGALLTLSSSDASRLLVSLGLASQGVPIVSAPVSALGRSQGRVGFCMSGVAESGEATVSVGLEGFAPRTVRVRLSPAVVKVATNLSQPSMFIDERATIGATIGVLDDAGAFVPGSVSLGSSPVSIGLSVSNPEVGTLSLPQIVLRPPLSNSGESSVIFTPTSAGQTTISASSPGPALMEPSSLEIDVVYPKLALSNFEIGKDLSKVVSFQSDHQLLDSPWAIAITSNNPQLLCFPASNSVCSANITVPADAPVFSVIALSDSGAATVRFASAALGLDGTATVQLTRPKVFLNRSIENAALSAGASAEVAIAYGSASDVSGTSQLRFGFNPAVSITSSDPKIVSVVSSDRQKVMLRALSAGRATLSVAADGFDAAPPLSVSVAAAAPATLAVSPESVTVGRDLQTSIAVTFPLSSTAVPLHVSSSDPSRVLVSAVGATGSGEADVPVSANPGFTIQALANCGTATVIVSAAGYSDVQIPVRLAPAGYAWTVPSVALNAYAKASFSFASYVLDAASLVPLSALPRRPGVEVPVLILSSNPASGNFSLSDEPGVVIFEAATPGKTTLSLTQPEGFTRPLLRFELPVLVNTASVSAAVPAFLGKDLQAGFTVSLRSESRAPITIRSDDPSLLLISTDPTVVGTRQVDGVTDSTFYLQALGSGGTVMVRISGTNVDESVYPVTLTAAGVAIVMPYYLTPPLRVTTSSPDLTLAAALVVDSPVPFNVDRLGLRPGANPVQIGIVSTQPAVAQPVPAEVTFTPGAIGSVNFVIHPKGAGDSLIQLVPPAPFSASASQREVAISVGQAPSTTLR